MAASRDHAPTYGTRYARSRRRRVRRWVVLGFIAIAVLVLADGAWAALGAKRELEQARSALTAGADALLAGDVGGATTSFGEAEGATERTDALLHHPAMAVAGVLPWIGDNVTAVRRLTDAAGLAAQTGTRLSAAADRVGWEAGSLQGLSSGDTSLTQTLRDAGDDIEAAAASLHTAQEILAGTPTQGLIGPVRTAVLDGTSELAGRAKLLDSATDLAQVLPALFEPGRRYLLVIQNPDEPRGTGGFMGYFGFLRSEQDQLHLEKLFPATGELVDHPVQAPADFRARYKRFDGLVDLRQVNFTPDLPTAADLTLQMARQLGWGSFDGILLVDPVWMQYMLEAIGPVDTPGWDVPISSDNVLQVLGHDAFLLDEAVTPKEADAVSSPSNVAQGKIGASLWAAIQTRDESGTAIASALARATAERHLQLYSVHAQEQAALSRLGASGEANLGKNPLYVVWVGLSANKAAWFAERSVDVGVDLADDGTATVTTTLHLTNHAPADGPAGELLGYGTDFPIGTWASEVSVYQPEQITGIPTYDSSGPTVTGQEREFGRPVSLGFVWAPSGRSYTWSVTYQAPDAVTAVGDLSEYRLDFLPQPTLTPIALSIQIHLPDGRSVDSVSTGMQTGGGTATFEGQPTTAQSMWVRFR